MRLMVFFDLPVQTKKERRCATTFRNWLLKDGYYMLQFSVYVRVCNGIDSANKHLQRVLEQAPLHGSVRALMVTERQYAAIHVITGEKTFQEKTAEQLTNLEI